ncbi:branched-chain amino acid transaminase [Immundisolibacter cernigliae]|uniref:Branched-chain-amino-acid aminotransferase n=1 Tax=Immundisolibacter cernigliae TaxID=1810504 RepID=A0A1B1YW65_9GAMM|nr:branched-chain amino acid transaminase [Immundisolibacter cernigliae]ANX05064.1 branched chain amino acid aminotransferase [Immundisolibacter cernigliae]
MGMEDRDGVIWFDGELVPWREAKVHVLTHSLHYGMGVFEGMRAYKTARGTALFRMPEHIDRMFTSAHILQMHIPFSREQIADACVAAIRENGLEGGYVRPLAFYGSEAMGVSAPNLTVHVIVAAWKWGEYLGEGALERGVRLRTSSYARHHVNVTMCRTKATGNYINSMLALREAQACGYDEALVLDVDGFVAEGSGENVFVIRKGVIYTPDIASALEGITRDTVITLAREAGYEVREKRITRDEVYIADEAFFTGTAAEVTPIRSLDDRLIGEGRPGPITKLLQDRYFATVNGELDGHLDWLTPVK